MLKSRRKHVSRPGSLAAALVLFALSALVVTGCGPRNVPELIPSRQVPNPLSLSGQVALDDSVVREKWMCRQEIPDPLAYGDDSPKIIVEAVLYGQDLIEAELRAACTDSGAPARAEPDTACLSRGRAAYITEHENGMRFRIRLDLRSTFSVNSLDTRFWSIYVKDEDGISIEPSRVLMSEPVIVRRDSLPRPGRAPVRAGLYERSIDLYFDMATPFGVSPLNDETREIRLIMARERRDVARFLWEISGAYGGRAVRARRPEGQPSDF